jgi:tRNA modification GTPase
VTLVDTAGVRTAGDAIEAEGVRRARAAQEVAALVLVVVDGSAPLSMDDHTLISASPSRLIVINKSDLSPAWSAPDLRAADDEVAVVSAATGEGLDELRGKIGALLTGHQFDSRDTPAISNVRHLELVAQARDSVGRAREALTAGATEETVLADLAIARTFLEAVVGRHAPDDLLEHVFSRFCVGK